MENMLDTFQIWNDHPIGIPYYKFNVANRPRSPYFNNTAFLASPLIADDEVFERKVIMDLAKIKE